LLNDKRGFVLLEVITAVLILSICSVAVLVAITNSTKQLAGSWQRLKAIELAQGKLDEIKGMEFDSIAPVPKTDFPAADGDYQYAVDVQNGAEYVKLKHIYVTVYFTEPVSGLEKAVTVAGARAKR
jgi:prepilin-type N-terminal cleavage/methylation domain-containing protein